MTIRHDFDVLVIGSGAAGLTTALELAGRRRVAVLTKGELATGSTAWAQGGVAAVMDPADSMESHINDTMISGAGLCRADAVRKTVENAPEAIQRLIDWGVTFDLDDEATGDQPYHLTREGGHSFRRILHVADATGAAISNALVERTLETTEIDRFEDHLAIDLVTSDKLGLSGPNRVLGAYVLNRGTGNVELFAASAIVLATGGASKVYLYTTNPDGSTGDGIAMAWRAGCRVSNLEFNQFHPTCLFHPHAKSFLISEAVRGEGGRLLLPDGTRFMPQFDERAELAPRDIVARAIDHEMKRLGADCVYLDISHQPTDFITHHFPTIHARCLELSIDITREAIPVVPAAHYTCGGVEVDLHGRTDVDGLYAIGEVSCTGLHGANRMASNSLLECLVFAHEAADDICSRPTVVSGSAPVTIPAWDESQVTDSDEDVVIAHNWEELRRFMWDYVGIVRSDKRLLRAKHRLDLLDSEIQEFYSNYRVSGDLIELRNLLQVADLIVRSAIVRLESRGLHFSIDHPLLAQEVRDTTLTPAAPRGALSSWTSLAR